MHAGCKLVDYCIVNSDSPSKEMIKKYKLEGSQVVKCDYDILAKLGVKTVSAPISLSLEHYRHDPAALASVIMDIYENHKTKE